MNVFVFCFSLWSFPLLLADFLCLKNYNYGMLESRGGISKYHLTGDLSQRRKDTFRNREP